MHAPAQRVHHLRLGRTLPSLKARRQRPAFSFTHRVSVPQTHNPSPDLAQRPVRGGQLPDLGLKKVQNQDGFISKLQLL
jgi:hypothetical protein